MSHYKIHAYVRTYLRNQVEQSLLDLGISGFSYCKVKGVGEYANFFNPDPHVEHARLEIFVTQEQVDPVVQGIVDAACTHAPGDGLIAVMPVEKLIRIRDCVTTNKN